MAAIPTRIWIDKAVKEQADTLLAVLGMEMSSTVNIFLHQCVLRGDSLSHQNFKNTIRKCQMLQLKQRRISRDPDVLGYSSMEDHKAAIESED